VEMGGAGVTSRPAAARQRKLRGPIWAWPGQYSPSVSLLLREGGGGTALPCGYGAAALTPLSPFLTLGLATVTTLRRGWSQDYSGTCWWTRGSVDTLDRPGWCWWGSGGRSSGDSSSFLSICRCWYLFLFSFFVFFWAWL
jgi:hypothetical protein